MTRKANITMTGLGILVLLLLTSTALFGQDTPATPTRAGYTFVYNQVPANYNRPLVGMVNVPEGSQKGFQLGFTNVNGRDFTGTQLGLTNSIGGSGRGAQIGLVNANRESFRGVQVSYVNVSKEHLEGAQIGYVNIAGKRSHGIQTGFVNVCKDTFKGAQVGYVNVAGSDVKGTQVGFVNVNEGSQQGGQVGFVNVLDDHMKGIQAGFVNVAGGNVKGSQLGFVNIADSANGAVPVGFVSIVRHGGFKVIEAGYSEMGMANLSVKFGVDRLYTFITASYNEKHRQQFFAGLGIGTILPMGRTLFFNPEIMNQVTPERRPLQITSFTANLGVKMGTHWSLVAGPTFVWQHLQTNPGERIIEKPEFSLYNHNIDNRNALHAGARASLRFHFN